MGITDSFCLIWFLVLIFQSVAGFHLAEAEGAKDSFFINMRWNQSVVAADEPFGKKLIGLLVHIKLKFFP